MKNGNIKIRKKRRNVSSIKNRQSPIFYGYG